MRAIRFAARIALLASVPIVCVGCSHLRKTPKVYYAGPSTVGMSPEGLRDVRVAMQPFIDSGKIPGAVTLVARNGKIVDIDAFGFRNVQARQPMRTDTIFRMYSMTKPVTAVAVMQLVDRGSISLSDPVSNYIPEFEHMQVLKVQEDGAQELIPATVPMTVEHLMTHTSGLCYGFLNPVVNPYYEKAGANDFSHQTLEEYARNAASVPLLNEPGAAWNYSVSMDILGRIVEIASGLPYDVYLQKNVFGPLGMVDSGFYVPEAKRDRFAGLYTPDEAGTGLRAINDPLVSGFLSPPALASGGAGMVGTIGDYYRFAQMLLNRGQLDGVRILSEQSASEIVRDHLGPELGEKPLATLAVQDLKVTAEGKLSNKSTRVNAMLAMAFRNVGFGYCGAVIRPDAMAVFGSPGSYTWGGLASTYFWIDPQENLVGILCTQLVPDGRYPTRQVFSTAVYKSIAQRRADGMPARESDDSE